VPRPKTISDAHVLETAHRLIHEHGPDRLTFARLAAACGLSSATLVQRFATKADLIQRTLLHAWDQLADKTLQVAAAAPLTPAGAIEILVALSSDYGGIESYARGLLVLREDVRDPVLRARGAAWYTVLSSLLDDCFAASPSAPRDIGRLLAAQWQGLVLWWSFDPREDVSSYVERSLHRFVAALASGASASSDSAM
jgi:AcrR family transcriptional regulator